MKKIVLYVIVLVFIIFLIPALFTISGKNAVIARSTIFEQIKSNENIVQVNENGKNPQYNYGEYSSIKVLHTTTNTVEEMNLDEYLYGVVSAEMPVDFEIEALKAQAVVARTYTLYHIINGERKHGDADLCDNSACCQAWISKENRFSKWEAEKQNENWNKICTAVNETSGKIITYEGTPINAFFHSNSGGITEAPVNVWGGTRLSILTSS